MVCFLTFLHTATVFRAEQDAQVPEAEQGFPFNSGGLGPPLATRKEGKGLGGGIRVRGFVLFF